MYKLNIIYKTFFFPLKADPECLTARQAIFTVIRLLMLSNEDIVPDTVDISNFWL